MQQNSTLTSSFGIQAEYQQLTEMIESITVAKEKITVLIKFYLLK